MPEKKNKYIVFRTSLYITVAVWAAVMFILLPSCTNNKKNLAAAVNEEDSLPDMISTGVTTLISDSGLIRYKLITEEWLIYTKRKPSFWAFEKGVYLEKFDSLFRVDGSIKADTAYFYDAKKLWELRGNVHIQNQNGDKFDTEQMFWDQNKERIYSDKFIRIEQIDDILTGEGFESNQSMTDYRIFKSAGEITVEDTDNNNTPTR